MSISTNSIIHYTNSIDILKKIISDQGFKLKYCLEKVTTRGGKSYSLGVAMVSFCDIPITEYKKHFKNQSNNNLGYYGDYGLGISKKWAVKNGLNPVLYIDYNSHVGTALRKTIDIHTKGAALPHIDTNEFQKDEFALFACYTKNYQGELLRKGSSPVKNYRFYDEREWRYVPSSVEIKGSSPVINGKNYEKDKELYNSKIEDVRLKYSIDDITYIIVKDETEIENLVNHIKSVFIVDNGKLNLLLTKIITSEQIMNDF